MKETEFQYEHNKIVFAKMVYDLLQAIWLHDKAQLKFYSFYLNIKNRVIGMDMFSKGTLNATIIHPREVFKGALLADAHAIIIAHNYPSGDVDPSSAVKIYQNACWCEQAPWCESQWSCHHWRTGWFLSFSELSLM